ncbi:hypothetical protein PIROE2DRAFT_65596 [Piromyces sp. E2]|nr:hypothetical protein PIROE2DRAFT_65596 [Piromyces sp. E2]|eukprot:OUM56326.1 hypothetical protein PIROE2DRAFT_65596 [Piromyces sp. E2]
MGLITNETTVSEYIAIGQHCSKLFRLTLFGFTMENAPHWSCYVHAITNFLTVGMESYIAMLFALRLWLMITRKNQMKMWLLEHTKYLTYICGLVMPTILSLFSILPQLIKGKSFVIPPNAENCITGFRQNAWQIILSGPGTTLPPFFLSASFGIHIAIVLCTVSTQNIMKDVKKFSTISYSSWIRMLWFGILFSLVVVINIVGDVKNSRNMIKNNTPEPGIKSIGIPYYLTAFVGVGVLLIFGTTVEAKKKLSTLFKSSLMGISSTLKSSTKMSQSNASQNMSINKSFNTSNITIDSNATLIPKSNSKDSINVPILQSLNNTSMSNGPMINSPISNGPMSNGPMPNIKNSVKAKKPEGEYEASLEFHKFMKSINDAVKEEDAMMMNNIDNEINYYSQSPPNHRMLSNGNITPRMMIPIQKFSPERIQQQQMQQMQYHQMQQPKQYPINNGASFSNSEYEYDYNKEDNQNLINKSHLFANTSNMSDDYYINMDREEGNNNKNNNNYIRSGTYTEEIVYPAKVSTSMRIKQMK